MEINDVIDGRWRVLRLLGVGAGGRVWLVREEGGTRLGALKSLKVSTEMHRTRVRREVQALQDTAVEGVVALYDLGEAGGEPYVVMEYIDGAPFPGLGRTWQEIVRVGIRLCEVLERVHGRRLIHRDLKPENVLVEPSGRVTVLDFGLARSAVSGQTITETGAMLGTPRYCAPEQVRGTRVDARADLYAVGVLLWEALAGRPICSSAAAIARASGRAWSDPEPLGTLVPELPDALVELVHLLLSREPFDRPASAREVIDALEAVLSGSRVSIRAPLPLLGREGVVAEVLRRVEEGEAVDLAAPPGGGVTRVLREVATELGRQGVPVRWVEPGERRYQSLVRLLGAPPADGASAADEMVARLERRLTEGVVVLVDDPHTLDASSRRVVEQARRLGRIVRRADSPGAIQLPPLTPNHLHALFWGPDRILHLAEDAAAELHHRTGGVPARVAAELDGWVAAGFATWEQGRVRVDRAHLDELVADAACGVPTGPGAAMIEPPGHLGDLLAWIHLGDATLDTAGLAAAAGLRAWEVEYDVAELVRRGFVQLRANGCVETTCAPAVALGLDEAEVRRRHLAIADALPPGHPRRLRQLLIAGDAGRALPEVLARAAELRAASRDGEAFQLLHHTWVALRRDISAEAGAGLLRELFFAALDGAAAHLRLALDDLRQGDPEAVAPLLGLGEAVAAAEAGNVSGAVARADTLPADADPRYVTRVHQLRVQACLESRGDLAPLLVPPGLPAGVPAARVLGWRALGRFMAGDFAGAMALHREVLGEDLPPELERLALSNLGSAALEADDWEACLVAAEALIAAASAARQARAEAWGWTLHRAARYRLGEGLEHDPDYLAASAVAGPQRRHAWALLVEAAAAWRRGDIELARDHAGQSYALIRSGSRRDLAALPLALWLVSGGGSPDDMPAAIETALTCPFPRLALQACSLLRWMTGPHPGLDARIVALGRELLPAARPGRWDVLTVPDEVLPL